MVGSPKPDIFEVSVRALGDVKLHERTNAVAVGVVRGTILLGARVRLKLSTLETTDTEVNVP